VPEPETFTDNALPENETVAERAPVVAESTIPYSVQTGAAPPLNTAVSLEVREFPAVSTIFNRISDATVPDAKV